MRLRTRAALAITLVIACSQSVLAIPQLINYQGVLADGGGAPVTAPTTVEFRIYDAATDGNELWMELQSVTPDADGAFSVLLGATNPIPDSVFSGAEAHLGLTIAPDPEMTPRTQLVAVAYAFRPGTIDGASAGALSGTLVITPAPVAKSLASDAALIVVGSGGDSILIHPDSDLSVYAKNVSGQEVYRIGVDTNGGAIMKVRDPGGNIAAMSSTRADFVNSSGDVVATIGKDGIQVLSTTVAKGAMAIDTTFSFDPASKSLRIGEANTAIGLNSIAVGTGNTAFGANSMAIGSGNLAKGANTVALGSGNVADSGGATVSGGTDNTAENLGATIGGGTLNTASGDAATVAGGFGNSAVLNNSTVGGGIDNTAGNIGATVAGGVGNSASGTSATVAGGVSNTAGGWWSSIGGGQGNWTDAGATNGVIGGGRDDSLWGERSVISGGELNTTLASNATIGGGSQNVASGDHGTVGGGQQNEAGNLEYATVSGGLLNTASGRYAAVGGGIGNNASHEACVISGGNYNSANGTFNTVGGGHSDTAVGGYATVCGGYSNITAPSVWGATVGGGWDNTASNWYSTVSGGRENVASGRQATVAGGRENTASGNYAFAAGHRAKAVHDGAFVWADSINADVTSSAVNQFTARTSGGARFYSNGAMTTGVVMAPGGGAWASISDRNSKENIRPVDGAELLKKIAQLEISRWNYKAQDASIGHIGPMAQDFYRLFGVGDNNTTITTIDPDGIALAAVKALYRKQLELDARTAEIDDLKIELTEMRELLQKLAEKE